MKILSVCTSIPENNNAMWLRISKIGKMLESKGHDVHFVHYIRKRSYDMIKNPDNFKNHSFIIVSPFTVHIKHLKFLRNAHYDLVYANTASSAFISLLGKVTKVPILFDMHGDIVEEFLIENKFSIFSSFLPNLIYKKLVNSISLRLSNHIITVSNEMINNLNSNRGIPLEKMSYITNGIDLDVFKPLKNNADLKKKLGIEDKFIFGYIGALDKWQGVDRFIDAAREIDDKDTIFLIVGWRKSKKENNIIYVPKVPYSQITNYYSICDVLTLPRPHHISTEVAAPTKFAEYTAMGKPILTTNVGDAANFVEKYKCGIVTKSDTPESLIDGINKFLNLSQKQLDVMGKNSRKLAENEFDLEKIAIKLNNVLDKKIS